MTETETTTLYRCGVTSDCPIQTLHLAGKEFPRFSERVRGHGHETRRDRLEGVVLALKPSEVKAIKAKAERKFLRTTTGKKPRTFLMTKDLPNYAPQEGDVPVSQFVYLELEKHDPQKEAPRPKTLADEKAEAAGDETEVTAKRSKK